MRSIKIFCFAAVCTAFLLTACGPAPTADECMRKALTSAKEAKWNRALDQAENAVATLQYSHLENSRQDSPWTEELGDLLSKGLQRVRYN